MWYLAWTSTSTTFWYKIWSIFKSISGHFSGIAAMPLVLITINTWLMNEYSNRFFLSIFFFFNRHFYFPAQLVGDFTLSDLLDKPWSQVSSLLPPRYVPSNFIAHRVQHSHYHLMGDELRIGQRNWYSSPCVFRAVYTNFNLDRERRFLELFRRTRIPMRLRKDFRPKMSTKFGSNSLQFSGYPGEIESDSPTAWTCICTTNTNCARAVSLSTFHVQKKIAVVDEIRL